MKKLFLCLLFSFAITPPSLAHSGRTNSSGCHNNRKTGGYHCHNGGHSRTSARRQARPRVNHSCQTLLSGRKGAWVFAGANLKTKILVKLPPSSKLVKTGKQPGGQFIRVQPVGKKVVGFVHKSVVSCP